MTFDQEKLATIEYAMSHPFHPNRHHREHHHVPAAQNEDHVWDKRNISKEEAMNEIQYAWKHPFHPHA